MREFIEKLLGTFRATDRARLLANGIPTPVEIEYGVNTLTLINLEAFPKYVRLPLIRGREKTNNAARSSTDGFHWKEIPDEISREFQIYSLLDPRIVLPHANFGREHARIDTDEVDGSYHIGELGLPNEVVEYFAEYKQSARHIRIITIGYNLISMIQDDFPPFNDSIAVVPNYYLYWPLFFWPTNQDNQNV